jgi:hypothetical protein
MIMVGSLAGARAIVMASPADLRATMTIAWRSPDMSGIFDR